MLDITKNVEVVYAEATWLKRRLPAHVELEELISVGFVGLCTAFNRYDFTRGIPFRSFARFRVRGAMLDWLNANMPQGTRIAVYLDAYTDPDGIADTLLRAEHDAPPAPDENVVFFEECQHLRGLLRKLERRRPVAAKVLKMRFLQEMSTREIARALHITDATVSNHIRRALEDLRKHCTK